MLEKQLFITHSFILCKNNFHWFEQHLFNKHLNVFYYPLDLILCRVIIQRPITCSLSSHSCGKQIQNKLVNALIKV